MTKTNGKKYLLFLSGLLIAIAPALVAADTGNEPITLSAVAQMQRARLSDDVIAQVIKTAPNVSFDVSADGIIALKQAGFSDTLILMIVERASSSKKTVISPTVTPAAKFIVRQGERELQLVPRQVETAFVQTKANTAEEVIKYGGLSAGVYAGAGVLANLALSTVGRYTLTGIAVGISAFGRKPPAVQGFDFEVLRSRSATLMLAPGDAEFILPIAQFRDGSYATAEPLLLRPEVSEKDSFRILSSQKIKVRAGKKTEKESLSPKKFSTVPTTADKSADTIRLKATSLPSGEYAIVFRSGDQLLPQVFDFRVTQ